MAIDVTTGSPLIIDGTNSGNTIIAATTRLRVRGIRWTGASTAGHTAVLTDIGGKVLWNAVALQATNNTQESIIPQTWTNGLKCSTLGSGILYIYLQEPEA